MTFEEQVRSLMATIRTMEICLIQKQYQTAMDLARAELNKRGVPVYRKPQLPHVELYIPRAKPPEAPMLKWSRMRDEHNDVVWMSGYYRIFITGENASAKPIGWGVKLHGEWMLTKPSVRHSAQAPRQMHFNSVKAAKLYCARHAAGFFDGKTSGLLKKNLSKS